MNALAQETQSRPISKAILDRDLGAVRRLVEGGEDKDQRLFNDDTPAIMAASIECWDIVLYLMKAGANPALANRRNITVAARAKTSRVAPHTKEHEALLEVKQMLADRGLM